MGMAWHMKTYYYYKINIYKILIQKQEIVAHILLIRWVLDMWPHVVLLVLTKKCLVITTTEFCHHQKQTCFNGKEEKSAGFIKT